MLVFDPLDPFPLIDLNSVAYSEQQAHSALVDEWLGIHAARVEAGLVQGAPGSRFWVGLPVQALLTPYVEIRDMLSRVEGESIVDLGAGYGRMGFVADKHFKFTGIEVVPERVREGAAALERFGASGKLIVGDLSVITPPEADVYFMYDYGSASAIEKTLEDLKALAPRRRFTVVGRGGATRDAIEKRHPWLSQVWEPQHFPHFSIYRS